MGAKCGMRFTVLKRSKRRAQPQPSIHKRFKRTTSKKAKKKSGKPKKSSANPICKKPLLRNYALKVGILRDAMSSFTRREIFGLAQVDRRSNAVVESDFPKAPYLTLPYIACHNGQWRWSPNNSILNVYLNGNQKFAKAKPIDKKRPIPEFLRFKQSYFDKIPTGDLVKELSVARHVYENGYLCVKVNGALRAMEFPSIVAKCHYLRLIADRSITMLSGLLKGACNHFWIWDNANNPNKQLAGLRQILDFLFKPRDFDICCKYGRAFLEIQIRNAMKYQLYEEIIGCIRERFLSTHDPSSFVFGVEHEDDLEWPNRQPFILDHPHSIKKLRLRMLAGNSFRISNIESDDIIVF